MQKIFSFFFFSPNNSFLISSTAIRKRHTLHIWLPWLIKWIYVQWPFVILQRPLKLNQVYFTKLRFCLEKTPRRQCAFKAFWGRFATSLSSNLNNTGATQGPAALRNLSKAESLDPHCPSAKCWPVAFQQPLVRGCSDVQAAWTPAWITHIRCLHLAVMTAGSATALEVNLPELRTSIQNVHFPLWSNFKNT